MIDWGGTIAAKAPPHAMVYRGNCSAQNNLQAGQRRCGENGISKQARAGKNLTNSVARAVAAATSRRFKSCRPDLYHLYVLRSEKTGRRYVGSCQDLNDRLGRHNRGESTATRHGVPWKLLRTEQFASRSEAMRRERYFKTGKGREELDQLCG
jgi:putative endonuclease